VTYDPDELSYEQLLAIFSAEYDPTRQDRQGPEIGDPYRSAIFVHGPEQRAAAEASATPSSSGSHARSRPESTTRRRSGRRRTTTSAPSKSAGS